MLVAMVIALLRHDLKGFLPVAALALWPSLGGHHFELVFGNGIRARIPQRRLTQAAVRLLVWFAGGVLLYVCMVATAHALPIKALPLNPGWCGGFLFVGVELVVHAILAIRGLPNFYNGRG